MPHTRKVALFLSLAVMLAAATSVSPLPITTTPPDDVDINVVKASGEWSLVEADWCDRICGRECDDCYTSYVEGCTCYWFCEDGDEGQRICTGQIGVRICS